MLPHLNAYDLKPLVWRCTHKITPESLSALHKNLICIKAVLLLLLQTEDRKAKVKEDVTEDHGIKNCENRTVCQVRMAT